MKNLVKSLICCCLALSFFGCEKPQETKKQDQKMPKGNKKSIVSQQVEVEVPSEAPAAQ